MAQTTTPRLGLVKNTPGTSEQVNVAEINADYDAIDNNFIPSAELLNTVTQSITSGGSNQKTVYNTTGHDSYAAKPEGAMASTANDEITIRKAGVYVLSIAGTFNANGTGIRRLGIAKNGSTLFACQKSASSTASTSCEISKPVICAVNDVISGIAFQDSGVSLTLGNNTFSEGSSLTATWLGSVT